MKLLNEANLVYFATCSSPVSKEGWLYKKGEVNKSFQKRWFVLKGNLLFYFEKPGDKEPVGVIILEGYTVELADSVPEGFTFQITFHGGANNRKYILQAESQPVMEDWMKNITCAGYEYMKLMVAELRAKLDELNAQENAAELAMCQKSKTLVSTTQAQAFFVTASMATFSTASVTASTASSSCNTRMNPFNAAVSVTASKENVSARLDLFGQEPFNTQTASLHVPKQPTPPTRKKRGSPLLAKKTGKTVFHVDKEKTSSLISNFDNFDSVKACVALRTDSRFLALHQNYGEMIRKSLPESTSKESLIQF